MKTHTVIDGNAFYEVDDECMERLKLGKRDKTVDADIQVVSQDGRRFRPEAGREFYRPVN